MQQIRVTAYAVLAMAGLLGSIGALYIHLSATTMIEVATSYPLVVAITLDAIVVGFAFFLWMIPEARAQAMRGQWWYVLLFFTTPAAFAVPLYLMMRLYFR